nr:hypothetical protein [Bacteroidota bacterium]
LMGNTQIMVFKIFWDWAIYWSVPCLLFTNKGFTDLKLLKELFVSENSLGQKFGMLNKRVQDMFIEWMPYEDQIFSDKYIDPLDLAYLKSFQQGLETKYESKDLLAKVASNMVILEQVAAEMFRLVSMQAKGTPADMKVDPYTISLSEKVDSESDSALAVDPAIQKEVSKMWFYKMETAISI